MKLRLLLRGDCDRACPGCCNKGWKLEDLPICTDFTPYDEVMLTGGEPMLAYLQVIRTARAVRAQNTKAPIYMYTARTSPPHQLGIVLTNLDGVTITLHEPKDVEPFLRFATYVKLWKLYKKRNLRVNVFKPMVLPDHPALEHWIIKAGMEWIVDCPLPGEEVFMRVADISGDHNWTGKR